jgi:filamentous hemagglutinin
VKIVSDMGDIEVSASRTTVNSYSHDKEMSVGLGDLVKGMTRPDQLVKNEDGRATVKLADAQYDQVDTKTTTTTMRGSTIKSNEDITLIASAGGVTITGSTLTADADNSGSGTLGLAGATGVTIQEATDTYETETKEVHGSAELSFVVQHQAAEVVKAVVAVDEAKDKLEQAKKDYKAYERNVSQLEDQLSQLESDYANKVPGVNYDDLLELRELVGDVKGDKEWYQAGIALAAVNLTSATTALVQQTAAAMASAGTWGFNAGVQLDIDASKSNTKEQGTTAVASELSGNKIVIQTGTANDDGTLNTKGTTTTISGSHLTANDRISIQTGDLNLLASKDTSERQSEQENGHITAQMTVYGASGGASITGSFDRSKESERSTTYNNTTLTANNIDLITSGDANIRGANVHANQHLEADIQGDLNLESMQNRSNSRNTSVGVSGGFSLGGDGKTNEGNAFTKNIQTGGDVGGLAGVNGGISSGNGMSVTRETVLTSLTSGGTANVNVGGHTQITGALLATIDDEGNDLNKLNFSTGSLNFTDLRNISQNSQTNAGISANFSVGDKKADTNPREGQPTAEGANGNTLYANTSNLTYSNSQENSASKTLATLGHGNITVGGTQLEKDGELTEAGKANGSPLIGMNRDTANTEKELWNSEQSQTVDATLDHRLLTEDGREQIKEDWDITKEGAKAAVDKIKTEFAVITTNLPEDKKQLGPLMEKHLDEIIRQGGDTQAFMEMLDDPEYQQFAMNLLEIRKAVDEKGADAFNDASAVQLVTFTDADGRQVTLFDDSKTMTGQLRGSLFEYSAERAGRDFDGELGLDDWQPCKKSCSNGERRCTGFCFC